MQRKGGSTIIATGIELSITVNAVFRILPLYQPTNWANCPFQWQPQVLRIGKHTFNPVINEEIIITFVTEGFPRFGLNSWVATERT